MTESSSAGSGVKLLRRYGPFVAVAIVVVAAIAVFGGGDDDGDDASDAEPASFDREELVRNGPMSWERAELEGEEDIDFGPNCDPETGRVKLPSVYAPPCVEPFDGDNAGETSMGVTEDSIKIVAYVADPAVDPVGAALVQGTGADLDPDAAKQTVQGYVDLYNELFETYGRKVEVEFFEGTGDFRDTEAAKADAIAIAEMEPFAVVGGPLQASAAFADELSARDVICGEGCGLALTEDFIKERFPLVWTLGPTSNQGSRLAADIIGNLAGPGKAELAGDESMHEQDRVYGTVHYDTPDGEQEDVYDDFLAALEEFDIKPETEAEFFLDPSKMQENARSIIAQLKDANVTTVLYSGDPLTPQALTAEATAQDFFPEWILGPNVLADTALFARGYDQEQWSNGFGIGLAATPDAEEISNAYLNYTWAYDEEPPSNIYGVINPPIEAIFNGIHLAGPELTSQSFRDGLFRSPPRGGGPVRQVVSYGDSENWPELDYGSFDDATLIWWDPAAEGKDEIGQEGAGMYRFAKGGERYTLGDFPSSLEEAGLFDVGASAIEVTELPEESQTPDYEPPDLG